MLPTVMFKSRARRPRKKGTMSEEQCSIHILLILCGVMFNLLPGLYARLALQFTVSGVSLFVNYLNYNRRT